MLARTQGSNRTAAALNRHLRSSRSQAAPAAPPCRRQPAGTVCAVSGIVASRPAAPAYCRTSRGWEPGTPLTGRNIPCNSSHRLFRSGAKALRTLHISSIQVARCSSWGPLWRGSSRSCSPGAVSGFFSGRTDLPGLLGSGSSRMRRAEAASGTGIRLVLAVSLHRTSRISAFGEGESKPCKGDTCPGGATQPACNKTGQECRR